MACLFCVLMRAFAVLSINNHIFQFNQVPPSDFKMSSAEQLAKEFEEGKDLETNSVGKRTKSEQAEHKHSDGDNTRKYVDNALKGEQKRKDENLKKLVKMDQQSAGSSKIKAETPDPAEAVNKIRRFKIFDDISSEQEKYKLPVYNYVDFKSIDTIFKYTTKCKRRPQHMDKKEPCCDCKPNECNTARCYCWKNSTIRLQNRKVKNIQDVLDEPMDRILIECRKECGCRRDCNNWMTDEKIQFRLEIDYFENKGFGIRIKDFASRGEYFGEYIGEIIEEQERSNVEYQFAITEGRGYDKTCSFVDAKIYGNATRFLNHSCNPCLAPFLFVRNAENSQKFPQLGFIFNRAVPAGNEITIDYAKGYWDAAKYDCCCGSFECMKPSVDTHYRTQTSSRRIQTLQKREDVLNERIVEEANLCKKRIELLQKGLSKEEVMRRYPRKVPSKKPIKYTPYTIYDRCPSPILPPYIERLDSDSEIE